MVTPYLKRVFRELKRILPRTLDDAAFRAAYHRGTLCMLICIGDCSSRVPINEFEPDAYKAAGAVLYEAQVMLAKQQRHVQNHKSEVSM